MSVGFFEERPVGVSYVEFVCERCGHWVKCGPEHRDAGERMALRHEGACRTAHAIAASRRRDAG